jgi:hypothetical protein
VTINSVHADAVSTRQLAVIDVTVVMHDFECLLYHKFSTRVRVHFSSLARKAVCCRGVVPGVTQIASML